MSSGSFKDHFSGHAGDYAAHRPWYPDELFDELARLCSAHERAWDCATGNGQAATGLARHFAHVVASDASVQQLENRRPHPRIDYCAGLAEAAPLARACCDLVTVAQSVHWFEFERFYAEVRRVLKPGGALALWTYGIFRVQTEIDARIDRFYEEVVGPYWPPERCYVETGYRTIPFPFAELKPPPIVLETHWKFDQVMNYIGTWSAVQRYREAQQTDPLPALRAQLEPSWGGAGRVRDIRWPLHLRVGRT
ncbi:MAG TPA: class I SAM-dependent methyltransferase [Steroidobacteraceae bacterium]|jgi:ubiquinone/menaquinone biosynthesis C-methylase UbiE